ncbi:MAG: hypothetical protein HY473_01390, partial [Candidatus Sungbacteria bacterium]|nr:hypothetical protein [Candidatus Sungbacteria bacterium]
MPPGQSDTDNTDFTNITNGAPPPGPNDGRPVVDVSATSTEAAAVDPVFKAATSTDGTGSKIGGTIFTGSSSATTTLINTLNVTRVRNVDAPGITNSTVYEAETGNEAELTTDGNAQALTGENKAEGGEGTATIGTGKAISTASVLNVVNTNLFNSDGLILFLDPATGDTFDLRDFDLSYFFEEGAGESPTQFGCTILTCLNSSALKVLNSNTATVTNKVLVRASTGANSATSTETGDVLIETGDAYAAANVLNLVNTNFINSSYLMVSLSTFGDLQNDIVLPNASFFDALLASGSSLPELNSSSFIVNNDNDENFFGTTTASAITGGNLATTTATSASTTPTTPDGSGTILTGNAYSASNNFTAANQTRVGGSSVFFVFRVWGNWTGTVKGLPQGLMTRETDYGFEIVSRGSARSRGTETVGEYNSSAFLASSTNMANVQTDVEVLAETGNNVAVTENGFGTIASGDAYAAANVVNMVNTNIVNRNWVFGVFNVFGDWDGDISFGGFSPDLRVEASASPTSA